MASRSFWTCCILLSLIVCSATVIPITLNYVGVKPRFYIQDLYIPSLNNSNKFSATNPNTSIFVDIKFKRVLAYISIRYQDVNVTLFHGSNTSSSVGYGVIPRFRQGKKKTVHRKVVVEARGLPWEEAIRNISGGSTVALAVEVATKYSKKSCGDGGCYYTKPKAVTVAAEVLLDGSGHKVSKNPIKLH